MRRIKTDKNQMVDNISKVFNPDEQKSFEEMVVNKELKFYLRPESDSSDRLTLEFVLDNHEVVLSFEERFFVTFSSKDNETIDSMHANLYLPLEKWNKFFELCSKDIIDNIKNKLNK